MNDLSFFLLRYLNVSVDFYSHYLKLIIIKKRVISKQACCLSASQARVVDGLANSRVDDDGAISSNDSSLQTLGRITPVDSTPRVKVYYFTWGLISQTLPVPSDTDTDLTTKSTQPVTVQSVNLLEHVALSPEICICKRFLSHSPTQNLATSFSEFSFFFLFYYEKEG